MRDEDSRQIHDTLLKHEFELNNLKSVADLHKSHLENIDLELQNVKIELVKLNSTVEHLAKALEKQNEIMERSLKK